MAEFWNEFSSNVKEPPLPTLVSLFASGQGFILNNSSEYLSIVNDTERVVRNMVTLEPVPDDEIVNTILKAWDGQSLKGSPYHSIISVK